MKYVRLNVYDPSPAALVVPESQNLKQIESSVQLHGLFHPIIMHNDQIVDGRARYRACINLGLESRLRFVEMDVKKWKCPSLCALSMNVTERKFSISQSFLMYVELSELIKHEADPIHHEHCMELLRWQLEIEEIDDGPRNSDWELAFNFHNFLLTLPHLSKSEREQIRAGGNWQDVFLGITQHSVIAKEFEECPF